MSYDVVQLVFLTIMYIAPAGIIGFRPLISFMALKNCSAFL